MGDYRVAVIGCGLAGLAAIKACLEEGLHPTCFEQDDNFGGTWNYTEEQRPNQTAPAYRNLSMNVTKEMAAYTDFFVPDDCPDFMVTKRFYDYLCDYAKSNDLLRYVHLKQTVLRVKPTDDYNKTGQWEVHVKSRDSEEEKKHVFDAVMLSSGSLRLASIPDLPGLQDFKGTVTHSMQYRRPDVFMDQTVLVVGNQFSAVDQACDLTKCTAQVYLSVGEGTNIIPRPRTLPSGFFRSKPRVELGRFFQKVSRRYLNHDKFGIGDGGNPYLDGAIALSDYIIPCLESGTIVITPRVKGFTENEVLYVDGTKQNIDAVLFATGYQPSFDFVDCPDIAGHCPNEFNLYKEVFPISCKHPTLAIVSVAPKFGPYPLIADNVARWVARVFAKKCQLPDKAKMKAYLNEKQEYYRRNCAGKVKNGAYEFADVIAEELGVKPDISKIIFKSPLLAYKIYYGPVMPAHYRLIGPGAQESCWERAHAYYDALFPDDISGKVRMLCKGLVGSLMVGAALLYIPQVTGWQLLSDWVGSAHDQLAL